MYKNEWDRIRFLAFYMMQPHMKKGAPNSPTALFPMPWDDDKGTKAPPQFTLTAEQRKAFEDMDRIQQKRQEEYDALVEKGKQNG